MIKFIPIVLSLFFLSEAEANVYYDSIIRNYKYLFFMNMDNNNYNKYICNNTIANDSINEAIKWINIILKNEYIKESKWISYNDLVGYQEYGYENSIIVSRSDVKIDIVRTKYYCSSTSIEIISFPNTIVFKIVDNKINIKSIHDFLKNYTNSFEEINDDLFNYREQFNHYNFKRIIIEQKDISNRILLNWSNSFSITYDDEWKYIIVEFKKYNNIMSKIERRSYVFPNLY